MVTSAAAFFSELLRRGFALTVASGNGLCIEPASKLTPTDRGFLRVHARAIVALLQPTPEVLIVKDSSDPSAIGGAWVDGAWHPPEANA